MSAPHDPEHGQGSMRPHRRSMQQGDHNLHYGDDSEDVKWLQIALIITGFLPPIAPDEMGHYGIKTTRAVGAYQRSKGIYPAPDSVGSQTRKALNAQFAI
jgi:peptidoglycan hydrolase-like protein with peptidoglycan-binding domain